MNRPVPVWGRHPPGRSPRKPLGVVLVIAGIIVLGCSDAGPAYEAVSAGDLAGVVTATDSGRVATTGLTLEAAGGGLLSTETDAGGSYFFGPVAAGVWTLRISLPIGFVLAVGESAEKHVTVVEGQLTEVDFRVTATNR